MRHNTKAFCIKFLIIFTVITCSSPAIAHTIKLFATAENETITGYGYFPGGGKYRKGKILVYGPDKTILGQTMTDDNGAFTFTAQYRCDHVFTIETNDGHIAKYMVKAAELPDSLPQLRANKPARSTHIADNVNAPPGSPSDAPEKPAPAPHENSTGVSVSELERIMNSALALHVRPLREQLEKYEQTIRLHDILGGIGYIFGIFGVAIYFSNRKKSINTNK